MTNMAGRVGEVHSTCILNTSTCHLALGSQASCFQLEPPSSSTFPALYLCGASPNDVRRPSFSKIEDVSVSLPLLLSTKQIPNGRPSRPIKSCAQWNSISFLRFKFKLRKCANGKEPPSSGANCHTTRAHSEYFFRKAKEQMHRTSPNHTKIAPKAKATTRGVRAAPYMSGKKGDHEHVVVRGYLLSIFPRCHGHSIVAQ